MKSKVLFSDNIDNVEEAVEELLEQASDFEFLKNSIAVVYIEQDVEFEELYQGLKGKWDFPIVGTTAMGMIVENVGYSSEGISVLLLTADDCSFVTGVTSKINKSNYAEEITKVYNDLSAKVNHEEKLILAYASSISSNEDPSGDDYVNILNDISNGKPVFGGLSSDNFNFRSSKVLYDGQVIQSSMIIILISGNIHPTFISMNSIENRALFSYTITKSEGNQVYKLGDDSFVDMLTREKIGTDKEEVEADFLLSPFVVSIKQPDGEYVEAARNLSKLNHQDGSGTFLGDMPEGSILGIGIIGKEDVQHSVEVAWSKIKELLKESEYEYSTVLITTCAARFLALASNIQAEAQICNENVPEGCSLLGMYAYGEFCPVTSKKTGDSYNLFHNFTFTVVAL